MLSSPSKSRPCCSNKKRQSNNKKFQDTEATGPTSQAVSLNTSALQVDYNTANAQEKAGMLTTIKKNSALRNQSPQSSKNDDNEENLTMLMIEATKSDDE